MLADELVKRGVKLVSGGTDNHLMLLDLSDLEITGKQVEKKLGKIGIAVNKNSIPNEKRSPMQTSGIRIGAYTITTRGFVPEDMGELADIIVNCI